MAELPNKVLGELFLRYHVLHNASEELNQMPTRMGVGTLVIDSVLVSASIITNNVEFGLVLATGLSAATAYTYVRNRSRMNRGRVDAEERMSETIKRIASAEGIDLYDAEGIAAQRAHVDRSITLARPIAPRIVENNGFDPQNPWNLFNLWRRSTTPLELRRTADRYQDRLLDKFNANAADRHVSTQDVGAGLNYAWLGWEQVLARNDVGGYQSAFAQGMARKLKTAMQSLPGDA